MRDGENKEQEPNWEDVELWDGDEDCIHDIETLWSGIKCKKCNGWFCY